MIRNKALLILRYKDAIIQYESQNPALFLYCWEQAVTNGLGYNPVRKSRQESKVENTEGLRKHLANMDLQVSLREIREHRKKLIQLFEELISIEENYQHFARDSIRLGRALGDMKNLVLTSEFRNELIQIGNRAKNMERILFPYKEVNLKL